MDDIPAGAGRGELFPLLSGGGAGRRPGVVWLCQAFSGFSIVSLHLRADNDPAKRFGMPCLLETGRYSLYRLVHFIPDVLRTFFHILPSVLAAHAQFVERLICRCSFALEAFQLVLVSNPRIRR